MSLRQEKVPDIFVVIAAQHRSTGPVSLRHVAMQDLTSALYLAQYQAAPRASAWYQFRAAQPVYIAAGHHACGSSF